MSHEPGERPFTSALQAARDAGRLPLIAEVKVRSPKEGELLAGRPRAGVHPPRAPLAPPRSC